MTVSYTHLDVYKRQDLIDNHWIQFSGAPAAIAASLITIAACFELS